MRTQLVALGIVGLVALTDCGALGPKTVVRDRFNYNDAIGESWKNQMFQNIVRLMSRKHPERAFSLFSFS